jgi:hypothetical protein
MIKNKRGFVIGNAILSVITIIVIVFIMGTFILIASAIASIHRPNVASTSQQVTASLFLSKKVEITKPDDTKKEATVLETIVLSKIYKEKLEDVRKQLADKSLTVEKIKQLEEEQHKYIIFLSTYKDKLKKLLEGAHKDSSTETCLIVIEKLVNIENNRLTMMDIDVTPTGRDLFISVKNGKAESKTDSYLIERRYAKENRLSSLPEITVLFGNGQTKNIDVAYYYGGCIND